MATYLEVAETIARRMGAVVKEYPERRGTFLTIGKSLRKGTREYLTFPQTPSPAKDLWVPGGHVRWRQTENAREHLTALRPIFVASSKPGATWADLEAETAFAQLREREKGINEALGIDLLWTTTGGTGGFATPESLFLHPILEVKLRVLLGEPHWKHGWAGGWVSKFADSVWVEDGFDVLERLRALLDGFSDGTYPEADPYKLLQPDWTAKKEVALAIEQFVRSAAPRREPEREYLNYFGFDDTTD